MQLAICDDEMIIARRLEIMVKEVLKAFNTDYKISVFCSGIDLLQKHTYFDLIFLDIEMPGLDGIDTGNKIHLYHPSSKIVMVTGHEERFKEAFKISAFRFVTKPFSYNEIKEVMTDYFKQNIGNEIIEAFYQRKLYCIKQNSIAYIQALDSYAEIVLKDMTLRKEVSLNELEKELEHKLFFRIHRKYIVNIKWIEKYNNGVITILGEQLTVSRRNRKLFEQVYMEYDLNYR